VASAFAFVYGVGCFSAFDIAWFTFFSLQDHVSALPVAIGLLVGLLIALRFFHVQSLSEWLKIIIRCSFGSAWICFLSAVTPSRLLKI
jgi:hypothetical protein